MAAAALAVIPAAGNHASRSADAPSLQHAVGLYRDGQMEAAAAEYNAIIAAGSQLPEAYAGLARVYIKTGKIEGADAASTKAVELAPDLTDAHVARGEVFFRQGKIGEAEQEFAAMIRKGTLNARAYLGEARVSSATSFDKQAKQMINMAYGLDHDDPEIRLFRAATFTSEELNQYLKENPPADSAADTPSNSAWRKIVNDMTLDSSEPNHPCTLVTKTKSTQTDLWKLNGEPGHVRGYGLRVQVNDEPVMMVVDTGRTGILIDQTVAARLNVRRIRNIGFAGSGERAPASGYQAFASSLRIADLEFKDCYVNVVDKNSVLGQDGVIGADVFSNFLADLDFADETFSLSELPSSPNQPETAPTLKTDIFASPLVRDRHIAPEMKSFVPFFKFGDHLLVSSSVNNSSPGLFILATGSARSSISIPLAKEFTTASLTASRRTQGSNGDVKTVYIANDVNLTFGNIKQLNTEIFAEDLSRMSNGFGTEISGTLGLSSLQKMDIKIDYRDGLVQFNFDANRKR
jgi:hypothetical protein